MLSEKNDNLARVHCRTGFDELESRAEYSSNSSFSSMSSRNGTANKRAFTLGGTDEFALRKAKERVRRAKIEAEGVSLDIQAALGISDSQLKACREWIAPFVGER
ncbi:hypothetical protein GYMLUDRAFT_956061 [Collybiopsis luxurians FD-317 M1]|nr:hypothetical protein GYMLUDRAFT_956061 [Collybiopsis luxurians FD-317 M1]